MKTVKFISIALAGALLVLSACKKGDGKEPEPKIDPTSERCNASDYPQVTIGTQTWMAENYRCSKYDTQSEAYNASWLTDNTIPTASEGEMDTPYYVDESDKNNWNSDSKTKYGVNLTDEQVKKLGYLYNWAAAVGVEDGQKQKTEFTGNRQGICPNGWHIPSKAEWQTLVDYIEKTDGKGTKTAGKHLKTTSGWYSGDSDYKPGLDSYSFALLPTGIYKNGHVMDVGTFSNSWTTSSVEISGGVAGFTGHFYYKRDYMEEGYVEPVNFGASVRCVKD
ncbi:MAG: hypothetical protein MJ003_06135 [Paludibacteraceae bacterium]|nr:hypothetical protein [Paludibacteraceae bacterium]